MRLWLNGALADEDAARIAPNDRGFLLGDGIFETLRIAGGVLEHRARHLARLASGAALLGLPVPGDLEAAIDATLAANGLAEGSLRITLSAGVGPRGLLRADPPCPSLLITTAPPGPILAPARLIVARSTRRNEHSPLSRIKSLGYGDQILARREAASLGADDALLCNGQGVIAGASAANLIWHDGNGFFTPAVAAGALPGIGRGVLIEAGLLREGAITPGELGAARQLWLLNALGLREVIRVGDMDFALDAAFSSQLLHGLRDPAILPTPF